MELWQVWIYQKLEVCVGQGGYHYSYESGLCRSHHLGPPQPPSELTVAQKGGRWSCVPRALPSRWDKAGSLLTRPRAAASHLPSHLRGLCCGWENSLISLFFSYPALPQATRADVLPPWQATYLPLTAAFMGAPSSRLDVINDDCQTEWGIFLRNSSFYWRQ